MASASPADLARMRARVTRLKEFDVTQALPFKFIIADGLARVVDVYDGDTITIMCNIQNDTAAEPAMYTVKLRIYGIDTPEKRPKAGGRSADSLRREKTFAEFIAKRVKDELLGQVVRVEQIDSDDKYGRILGRVTYMSKADQKQRDLTTWLIEQGYGVAYGGETKAGWEDLTDDFLAQKMKSSATI